MYNQLLAIVIAIVAVVAQESEISSDISVYEASITAEPEFTSAINFLATGVDRDVLASITQGAAGLIPLTATPAWLTVLPTDVQDFLESAGSAERKISSSVAWQYAITYTQATQPDSPKRNAGPPALNKAGLAELAILAIIVLGNVFLML